MVMEEIRDAISEYRSDPEYIELGQLVQTTFIQRLDDLDMTYLRLAELVHKDFGIKQISIPQFFSEIKNGYPLCYLPPFDIDTTRHYGTLSREIMLHRLAVLLFHLEVDPEDDLITRLKSAYQNDFVYPPEYQEKVE